MTAPDMAASITPKSDQINAEDLLTGPRTVTITAVKRGSTEQPVDIVTAEFGTGRPYKPSKTMRRIIIAAWGKDPAAYVGRRMTIYCEPDIMFGGVRVGGIRISHMSNVGKRIEVALTVTRGKRAIFTVEPLPDAPPELTPEQAAKFDQRIAAATTIKQLDTIAADLKTAELGDHRERLITAWSGRRAGIAGKAAE